MGFFLFSLIVITDQYPRVNGLEITTDILGCYQSLMESNVSHLCNLFFITGITFSIIFCIIYSYIEELFCLAKYGVKKKAIVTHIVFSRYFIPHHAFNQKRTVTFKVNIEGVEHEKSRVVEQWYLLGLKVGDSIWVKINPKNASQFRVMKLRGLSRYKSNKK